MTDLSPKLSTLHPLTEATPLDIPAIAALEFEYYAQESFSAGVFYQAIAQWPSPLWVVKEGQQLLGYALIGPGRDTQEAWIMAALVAHEGRGKGIGKALCQACIESASARGVRELKLTVAPDNQVAVGLYQQLGFTTVTTVADFFGPGEDRLLMSLAL